MRRLGDRASQLRAALFPRTQNLLLVLRSRGVGPVVALAALIGVLVTGQPAMLVHGSGINLEPGTPEPLQSYQVQLAKSTALVKVDAPLADLITQDRQERRDRVAAILDNLRQAGTAGAYTFDDPAETFHVTLAASAVQQLSQSPTVAAVTRDVTAASPAAPSGSTIRAQSTNETSINYIQVYTPFMWGKAPFGGQNITLTLESSPGTVIGVATQTFNNPPNNHITIDSGPTLYYETVFVDPTTRALVTIMPGDDVHAVMTGIDRQGNPVNDDRRITVDDIRAYTSYGRKTVFGTAPPNTTIRVSVLGSPLMLDNYLTPNGSNPFSCVTTDGAGNFSASTFKSVTSGMDPTDPNADCDTVGSPASPTFSQGVSGFVRVKHATGDEVYTVHGQNNFVLESSYLMHGWAFMLPWALSGTVDSASTFTHPLPVVNVTLKDGSGNVKDSQANIHVQFPFQVQFAAPINAGDHVEVQIFGGPANVTVTSPLSGTINTSNNQISGSGPPSTPLTVAIGTLDGYQTKRSFVQYSSVNVTSQPSGAYNAGPIGCGQNNVIALNPGSFGYVGYEDPHANFVYLNFAAPTNSVLANMPFVEGWLSNGLQTPVVTVRDGSGNLKSQNSTTPTILWIQNVYLFINTYYNVVTSQFVNPGDSVTVQAGAQTWTIPVDQVSAYLDLDQPSVVGTAPPGSSIRVIPDLYRTSFQNLTVNGGGTFTAPNPFPTKNDSNCDVSPYNVPFQQGYAGRTYVLHPDGNSVFTEWGRSIHAEENENKADVYFYPNQNVDWWDAQSNGSITVTKTPASGSPFTTTQAMGWGLDGHTQVLLLDAQSNKVLIRPGDNLDFSFTEGFPSVPGAPTRPATLRFDGIPLALGSPDTSSNTIGGIAPAAWYGTATLASPINNGSNPFTISPRAYPAFGPTPFRNWSNQVVPLGQGYSGQVSFSDLTGDRVYSTWAATALPVKITPMPRAGDTQVCGTAPPSSVVHIHDMTNLPSDVIIGTGNSDGTGHYCVAVSPPLYKGQVIIADSAGEWSQPVVVGLVNLVYLPSVTH